MAGDEKGQTIHDGVFVSDEPIATSSDYVEFSKKLVADLNASAKRFNITSLTLLHTPPARTE